MDAVVNPSEVLLVRATHEFGPSMVSLHNAAPEAVRRTVLASLISWFVLDNAGSIASGNASKELFNVAVLLLAVGLLRRPARGLG